MFIVFLGLFTTVRFQKVYKFAIIVTILRVPIPTTCSLELTRTTSKMP